MGEEKMRRGAIAVMSALIALLFVQPVSGQSSDPVEFVDRPDDLGHPVYFEVDGLLEPASYWPATSPVGQTGYLDMLGGFMSVQDGVMTAELRLAGEWTSGSAMPKGVKAVWWTWFFCEDTSIFEARYSIHVRWDGNSLDGVLLVRGDNPERQLTSFEVRGHVVHVEFDSAYMENAVGWFAESICWNYGTPETDDQGYMPYGGWFAADITDGPMLPWLSMPE